MDDQQTYLLNGLLSRQFDLGRIVRFRQVVRGRQAVTYEILTAQQHEYLVYLYPPAYSAERLTFLGETVNVLDENRFTVVPMLKRKEGGFVAEGPQGSGMMVSLTTSGSALSAAEYTEHDVSQVGLRLAWMHRLLREKVPAPAERVSLAVRLERVVAGAGSQPAPGRGPIPPPPPIGRETVGRLVGLMSLPMAIEPGWTHGDIQVGALLHDADHQLRTVVDWGLLHWGSPLEDLVDAYLALCVRGDGTLNEPYGRALLEAYDTLVPLEKVAWTPVVAAWCGQRLVDAVEGRRGVPQNFSGIVGSPEAVGTAIASCR